MDIKTAWLIGSITSLSSQTIVVDGNSETLSGSAYLYDSNATYSWLDKLSTVMDLHLSGVSVTINQAGYIKLTASTTFTITWTSTLQQIFGFTSNLSGASSYTGSLHSILWWSPIAPVTTNSARLTTGIKVPDTQILNTPDGLTPRYTRFFTPQIQTLSWALVPNNRYSTVSDNAGEFYKFWNDVVSLGYKFKCYADMTENASSTTAVTWGTELGPYQTSQVGQFPYNRQQGNTDLFHSVSMECFVVSDFG